MSRFSTPWRRFILLAWAVAVWTAFYGVALAGEAAEAEKEGGGGAGAGPYVGPYFAVALCIGLGLLFVCRSARRRERPKGEAYEGAGATEVAKEGGVPEISLGMRLDQVNKLLGKPKIRRRGSEIYRELAMAGKLSEEDAAKEYLIYEHAAGRYELVVYDRRVVEIKGQPKRKKPAE